MRQCCHQRLFVSILVAACVVSCKREERPFRVQPPDASTVETIQTSELHAGGMPSSATQPTSRPGSPPPPPGQGSAASPPPDQVQNPYELNAYALSEGKNLYQNFNCVGCHFHGGGGIGPPLMDEKWIYGSRPEQIFATIVEGRPNGMPAFRGKIADYQVWEIVAYVRSMSGNAARQAMSGRDDHISMGEPENSRPKLTPTQSTTPR